MKLKRLFFLIFGCISLGGGGCAGIVLPVLPTVLFFLLTVFCFANSSRKFHDWFKGDADPCHPGALAGVASDCLPSGELPLRRNRSLDPLR